MKLLYGTGNPAKLLSMRHRLEKLGIELIGLADLKAEGFTIPEVPEDGTTPLENARQKATAYYEAFKRPVFSCDSGLYFDGVPDEIQPGVHVRTVNGKYLTDEQMIAYYTGLAKQYGNLTARYKNAICFVMDEKHIYEAMEPSIESERFIITDTPHSPIRKEGFPLNSLSIDIKTNKYYYDLPEQREESLAMEDGFLSFFRKALSESQTMTPANELLSNLSKLHTTELGVVRIKRNLSLDVDDVVKWCRDRISSEHAVITRKGKNWYIETEGCIITVNAYSYTIITAHKEK